MDIPHLQLHCSRPQHPSQQLQQSNFSLMVLATQDWAPNKLLSGVVKENLSLQP